MIGRGGKSAQSGTAITGGTEKETLVEAVAILERSLQRYAAHYDQSPIGLLTLDRAGVIRELNLAACWLLRVERPRALGRDFRSFVTPDDHPAVTSHLAACHNHGSARSRLLLQGKDGVVSCELTSRRAPGDPECYGSTLDDASERERLRTERADLVEETQGVLARSAARDQFFAMVSHELRAPLTPILAAVAALERGESAGPDARRLIDIIKRNALIQARLTEDLLDATKIARGKMNVRRQPLALHQVVRQSVASLTGDARDREITLDLALAADRDGLHGDQTRLRQVFDNLVRNALKFTPPGGHIWVRSWSRDDRIAVEVSDTGIGLSPQVLDRLFAPFEQFHDRNTGPRERGQGLGLGLSISRGLVELHGGSLSASSAGLGKGARFVVELPLSTAVAGSPEDGTPASPLRLLLVEDNADASAAFLLALRDRGYQVETVSSVASALAADLAGVDVLISDINLTDGDGRTMLRRLRRPPSLVAIAVSGNDSEADERRSREAGFFAHLAKPIDIDTLTAVIEEASRSRGTKQETPSPGRR